MSALLESLLDSERRGACAIHDGIAGHDSPAGQRHLNAHLGELADAANAAELRARALEDADVRTRAAREAIKGLARSMTEQEACALVATLHSAILASGWGHTDKATSAIEGLADCVWALEN